MLRPYLLQMIITRIIIHAPPTRQRHEFDMTRKIPASTPAPHLSQPAGSATKSLESRDLMQGRSQIEIVHRGEIYRLRITRQGKLILTK